MLCWVALMRGQYVHSRRNLERIAVLHREKKRLPEVLRLTSSLPRLVEPRACESVILGLASRGLSCRICQDLSSGSILEGLLQAQSGSGSRRDRHGNEAGTEYSGHFPKHCS